MMCADLDAEIDDLCLTLKASGIAIGAGFKADDCGQVLNRLAHRLGQSISYVGQPLAMDIKPTKNCGQMSFGGTSEFPLHTDLAWYPDPPRYLAMFCIHPGNGGGAAVYADAFAILDAAEDDLKSAWQETELFFPGPSHVEWKGEHSAIFSERDGQRACRFNTRDIWDDLDEPSRIFAERLFASSREVSINEGDLFVYDNWRYCHGRTAISDPDHSQRWLKRMYIKAA